jgi:hypothetical protein
MSSDMTTSAHVVLGGNGIVGRETVRALLALGHSPASVGRRPAAVDGARSVTADLLDPADVARAIRGAEVAYLVAGLPYSSRVWAEQWPGIVGNTVDTALEQGVHVVYLDNVYAYGRVSGPMTESTPIEPSSKKGLVRAAALRRLDDAAARGLAVTIGRSADFYGPGASTSVFNTFALDKISARRPRQRRGGAGPHLAPPHRAGPHRSAVRGSCRRAWCADRRHERDHDEDRSAVQLLGARDVGDELPVHRPIPVRLPGVRERLRCRPDPDGGGHLGHAGSDAIDVVTGAAVVADPSAEVPPGARSS